MEIKKLKESYLKKEILKSDFIDKMYDFHDVLFQFSEDLENTSIEAIRIEKGEVVFKMKGSGVELFCRRFDKRLAPLDAFNFNDYEDDEMTMQLNLLKPDDVVLDIGANIGWYSLTLSRGVKNLKIHAFEPLPSTYELLNKNIQLNQVENISVHNVGLSNKNEITEFFIDPKLSVNASAKNVAETKDAVAVSCKIVKLDKLVQDEGINKVDFIKCDVEGAEYFSFLGGKETLIKYKPIVFSEMLRKWTRQFDYHPNDIISFFKEIGYLCFIIDGDKISEIKEVTDSTLETNFIFLHQEKHVNEIKEYAN